MHRTFSTGVAENRENSTEFEDASAHYDQEEDSEENGTYNGDLTVENSEAMQCNFETLQKSSALFILGTKEKHKLTQTAIQGVLDGVTNLSQHRLSMLHSKVTCIGKCHGKTCQHHAADTIYIVATCIINFMHYLHTTIWVNIIVCSR